MTRRARAPMCPAEFMTPFDDAEDEATRAKASVHVARAWADALEQLMNCPISRSNGNRVAFVCGKLRLASPLDEVRSLVTSFDRDVIYLDFAGPMDGGPSNVVYATPSKQGIKIFEHCEPWAFKPWQRVELVAATHRIQVSDEDRIRLKPNNLDELRARRVRLAQERWRQLAVECAKGDLASWKFVPPEFSGRVDIGAEIGADGPPP